MSQNSFSGQPLLTFPDAEKNDQEAFLTSRSDGPQGGSHGWQALKSPLSIRAKALVFIDPRSRQLRDQVELLATQPLPLLIEGETGTGKELLARHIHRASERPGLFVALSCSGLSSQHARAELFGIYAQRLSLPLPVISDAAQQLLEAHSWPGNTRELENVIHFALLVSSGEEILSQHLNLAGSVAPLTALQQNLEQLFNQAQPEQLHALQQLLEHSRERLQGLLGP